MTAGQRALTAIVLVGTALLLWLTVCQILSFLTLIGLRKWMVVSFDESQGSTGLGNEGTIFEFQAGD